MPHDLESPVASAFVALQRAITPEEVWQAAHALMHAATPTHFVVLGLPSLGIMPFFLRTTMPTRDIGRFGQLAPLNTVIATHPGLTVARMSDYYTAKPGDPFFEEFLQPDGWLHAAALLFWSEAGHFVGQLASLRTAAQGDFTTADLEGLRRLHPAVNAAVNRLLTLENAASTQVSLEHTLHALPLPIVIVAWDLSIRFTNTAATEAIHRWRHGPANARALKPAAGLPEELTAACVALKDGWSEAVRTHDFSALTRSVTRVNPATDGLSATIRLVESPAGRALHPSLVIHFELPRTPDNEVSRALGQFALLSPAERAVAILAAEGHDNAAIAKALSRSLSTVRTHLRNVFRKLGITTRARLAPLLQGLRR